MPDKVFKTYKEQRELLIERGLSIPHPRSFTNCMQMDDYYNIINLKSRRKLNLQSQNLVFTRVHSISSTILGLCRVSFITLPKNAVNPRYY